MEEMLIVVMVGRVGKCSAAVDCGIASQGADEALEGHPAG